MASKTSAGKSGKKTRKTPHGDFVPPVRKKISISGGRIADVEAQVVDEESELVSTTRFHSNFMCTNFIDTTSIASCDSLCICASPFVYVILLYALFSDKKNVLTSFHVSPLFQFGNPEMISYHMVTGKCSVSKQTKNFAFVFGCSDMYCYTLLHQFRIFFNKKCKSGAKCRKFLEDHFLWPN